MSGICLASRAMVSVRRRRRHVAVSIVPGGGAVERLPLLVGRAHAIEILLGSDDIDAATAERYGPRPRRQSGSG